MSRPWMPLYVADYLADTQHLTATEHGAYLLLLMHHWHHGKLPASDEMLTRIARVHPPHWPRIKRVLGQFFNTQEDGSWTQKRMVLELNKADEISNKRKDAALQKHSKSRASAVHLHTHARASSQSQSHKQDAADAALPSEEADYFRRGKQLLGPSTGGLLAKLKAAKGSIPLARAALETAATKQDAREYLAAIIRGRSSNEADQWKAVDEAMRRKGSAVVFADEVPGGIPGIV